MATLRNIIIYSIFFLSGIVLQAQDSSLVRFSDLNFNSDFEKQAFKDYASGAENYLELFVAVSPQANDALFTRIANSLKNEYSAINDKKFSRLKDDKKVNRVYAEINSNVLGKYRDSVLFPDIFTDRNFNCLTASAYYGFIFRDLGIDFEIKETANHVHPVAYPKTLQIKVETTDPVYGFRYFDQKLKLQFVVYLLSAKVITREEVNKSSIDEIFNKYYFPETSIGLRELAGLQYLNDAFYHYSDEDCNFALHQIQKAYFLYPSKRVSMVMLFLLSRCLAETEFEKPQDAAYLVYASRFVGSDLTKDNFIAEFVSLSDKVFLQRSDNLLYDQLFQYLMEKMDKGDLKESVKKEYYFRKGAMLMNTFRIKEALDYLKKALSIEPENTDLQTICLRCLALTFKSASNQEIVKNINEIEKEFPQLQSNETFTSFQMVGYLQLAEEKFDFDNPQEGEMMLKNFENIFRLHKGISVPYREVGDAYSAAAVYYFKRNQIKTTRSYLERGLAISPENYELMYRLRALED